MFFWSVLGILKNKGINTDHYKIDPNTYFEQF